MALNSSGISFSKFNQAKSELDNGYYLRANEMFQHLLKQKDQPSIIRSSILNNLAICNYHIGKAKLDSEMYAISISQLEEALEISHDIGSDFEIAKQNLEYAKSNPF